MVLAAFALGGAIRLRSSPFFPDPSNLTPADWIFCTVAAAALVPGVQCRLQGQQAGDVGRYLGIDAEYLAA